MTAQDPQRTGTHPLRTRGRGRTLYAAGLVADLSGLLLVVVAATVGLAGDPGTSLVGCLLGANVLQHSGNALRRRAWWHVPLRGARPRPDRVDTAFWTVFAVVLVVLSIVSVQRPPSDAQPFGLWPLLMFAGMPIWFSPTARNLLEPAGRWSSRAVPCAVAVLAVLWLGATHDRFSVLAAVGAGTAVAAGALVVHAVQRRRTPKPGDSSAVRP